MIHEACDTTSAAVQSRAADLADRFTMEVGGVLLAADLCMDGCWGAAGGQWMGVLAARTLELAASLPATWGRICELGGIPAPAASIPDLDTSAGVAAAARRAVPKRNTARAEVLASLRIAALQVAARIRELTDEQLDRVVESRNPRTPARSVESLIIAALIRRTHGHFERLLLMGC